MDHARLGGLLTVILVLAAIVLLLPYFGILAPREDLWSDEALDERMPSRSAQDTKRPASELDKLLGRE
jgi:hypothetical protein